MISWIAKVFGAAAVVVSLLLVIDSLQGLRLPEVAAPATIASTARSS